jgi:hypothetical protein
VNKPEEILKSFKPYYRAAQLEAEFEREVSELEAEARQAQPTKRNFSSATARRVDDCADGITQRFGLGWVAL